MVDLGINRAAEVFVRAAEEEGAKIVGMSALLTITMPEMRNTIEARKAAGIREKLNVIVGGAPVSSEYATQIGADGYARDTARAEKYSHHIYSATV